MQPIEEAASDFLSLHRIAVTGVSRTPASHGANVVFNRLRERGYLVFAVNPNANEVEGAAAFHDLRSIPGGVDAVVIATRAATALETMKECDALGIKHVWLHRAFGQGSLSKEAVEFGRERGICVIDGGCPCMFGPASDPGHKVMKFVLELTGKVPRQVS
ncbi:MAG: CoA-binding protein [Myxococcaceae bacterium]